MHFLKEGQKIRAWVDPPPLIFLIEAFPNYMKPAHGDKEKDECQVDALSRGPETCFYCRHQDNLNSITKNCL